MTGKKTKEEKKQSNMDEKKVDQQPSKEENKYENQENSTQTNLNPDNDVKDAYEKLMIESKEYFEGWQRERADFLNYKKRIERDQQALKNYLTGEVIKEIYCDCR